MPSTTASPRHFLQRHPLPIPSFVSFQSWTSLSFPVQDLTAQGFSTSCHGPPAPPHSPQLLFPITDSSQLLSPPHKVLISSRHWTKYNSWSVISKKLPTHNSEHNQDTAMERKSCTIVFLIAAMNHKTLRLRCCLVLLNTLKQDLVRLV